MLAIACLNIVVRVLVGRRRDVKAHLDQTDGRLVVLMELDSRLIPPNAATRHVRQGNLEGCLLRHLELQCRSYTQHKCNASHTTLLTALQCSEQRENLPLTFPIPSSSGSRGGAQTYPPTS